MADATLSTEFSRRAMLGGAVAVSTVAVAGVTPALAYTAPWRGPLTLPSPTGGEGSSVVPRIDAPGDARLAVLAGEYRRVMAALHAWVDLAEARGGPHAYDDPPYRERHEALWARANGLVTEIALLRPDSIYGLAVKLRAGVFYDYAGEVPLEFDQRLLGPVLDDLDRMAEAALFDGG